MATGSSRTRLRAFSPDVVSRRSTDSTSRSWSRASTCTPVAEEQPSNRATVAAGRSRSASTLPEHNCG
ncbi:hypothetical protein JQK87_13145 [Streptomyces sp. G44]|uniref:hypothetical protein n=1 Tax=Streptomyces sp. G44 TaxID=2807632 RepID=UPI001960B479|nr:hypothetical protein [Streptomyces sp. G44]MBM7169345.1 hypothetical protein [Streptomyces sp. G44]